MKKVGLFFGSFNPIHIGHLIIAEYMISTAGFNEVWLVVSPQNPFKNEGELFPENHRLQMAKLAVRDNEGIKVNEAEFSMPKPSYTIQTLNHFSETYPEYNFGMIMGSDNIVHFEQWRNAKEILEKVMLHVYRREGYHNPEFEKHDRVRLYNAPVLHISATFIRELMNEKKSIRYLVPDAVIEYMKENKLYTL
jgi:nicotinate-nucleotide adenylyltransferase